MSEPETNYELAYKTLVDKLLDLCNTVSPEGRCLYSDEEIFDCEAHCDCSWGTIWHQHIRNLIKTTKGDK